MADRSARHRIRGRRCPHDAYLMSCDQYDELRAVADDRCQICGCDGASTNHGFLVIDHHAELGMWAVRGILCSDCNSHRLPKSDPASDRVVRRYLAGSWYLRALSEAGLTVTPGPEPPIGTVVQSPRRKWVRKDTGWEAMDRYPGREATWSRLHWRFGPHNLRQIKPLASPNPAHNLTGIGRATIDRILEKS